MAKSKVGKIQMRTVNGIDLKEPIKLDVFYENNRFFIYTPEYLIGSIKPEDSGVRYEGAQKFQKKRIAIIVGNSPGVLETKLWTYLDLHLRTNYKEEKVIHYNFRFNSRKTPNVINKNISFADTPAMSLHWGIHNLVTFADGRKVVLSHPYERYGNVISHQKFDMTVEKYSERYRWITWTEERQKFFSDTELAMENLIEKVHYFFDQDPLLLANAVDNIPKLIN